MLQQTSVARVLPKFESFIDEFPTPAALAEAPLGDALRLWTGLGYPRRCRNLRDAAIAVTEHHAGEFPRTLHELLALPGVGQYTARAVLAFAFDETVAVVDTNVSRVLSRLEGESMPARRLQTLADSLVPDGLGWEWNQVVMDFGARVCTARAPGCADCALSRLCTWRGEGEDPAPNSAGASRPQSRFEGSDRQARGRALRAVADGVTKSVDVLHAMRLDDTARADGLVDALVAEGLLVRRGSHLTLP
ncbi:MAG: A/G-specific adenine glycosylase [Actinomycetota bacterium]